VFDLTKEVVLVTVKERILAIRLLEKAEKQVQVLRIRTK